MDRGDRIKAFAFGFYFAGEGYVFFFERFLAREAMRFRVLGRSGEVIVTGYESGRSLYVVED